MMLISSTMSSAETTDDERSIPESTVRPTMLNEPTRLSLVVVIILFVVLLICSFHWFSFSLLFWTAYPHHFPLDSSDATHHPPVVLAAVARAWADVATAEAQDVDVASIVRRRRPIAPGEITAVDRRTTRVPGIDKVVRIAS